MSQNGAGLTCEPDFDLPAPGCLEFLWPGLPEALVGEAERQWIEEAAARLPPIPRLALELRLGEDEPGVDLHQRISARGADAAILKRHLGRRADGLPREKRLRRFLSKWAQDGSALRDDLADLYLEWDQPRAGSGSTAPGLFLPVDRPGEPEAACRLRRALTIDHAERLQPGIRMDLAEALDQLSARLPMGVSLNFLGFMLGREGAFRINLRGLRPANLSGLLEAIGWGGDVVGALRYFEALVGLSDRVIVALDFAPRLQPRIGFESVLDRPPEEEPRWSALFDYLVGDKLCAKEKGRALQALPARFFPEDESSPWPAPWLLPAVMSGHGFVPWVERRLSHLKLSIGGDGAAGAKAYVSAQHHWSRGAVTALAPASSARARPVLPLASAVDKGIAFVVAAIGQDDLWRDFSMPGASDEWVTAFVGSCLAAFEDERARFAVSNAVQALLGRQRPEGGWGYNGLCPPDADSTAWAVKFLDAAGYSGPCLERAEAFLLSHRCADGGVSTYAEGAPIRFDDRLWDGPSEGWRSSHVCVTANAAGAMPGPFAAFLRSSQGDDGSWPAYWWRGDSFSTALAVEALGSDAESAGARERAISWAHRQSPPPASAFDRAWLSRILFHGEEADRETARLMLFDLAGEQSADGGWSSGAELLLPYPAQLRRDEDLVPFPDVRRVFTTASVLATMAALAGLPPT